MPVQEGKKAPDFELATDGNGKVKLSALKGQNVIVYFYPKDDTSGCTKESCGFNEMLPDFDKLNAKIIGISKDSVKSHDKFKEKYHLNFTLASDEAGEVCDKYGVWVEKSMYGRKYMGIERSTFLIDANGIVQKAWRKVNVPGHVEEVYEALQDL